MYWLTLESAVRTMAKSNVMIGDTDSQDRSGFIEELPMLNHPINYHGRGKKGTILFIDSSLDPYHRHKSS